MKRSIFLLMVFLAVLMVAVGCAGPGNSYSEYKNDRVGKRNRREERDRNNDYYGTTPYGGGSYSPYYRRW